MMYQHVATIYNNHITNRPPNKSIEWLNERIARCQCPVGNQIYRSILVDRLVTARQIQKLNEELGDFDGNVTDSEVDQLVDAVALAHSINNQLPPFSSLH